MTDAEVREIIEDWDGHENFESFAVRRLAHVEIGTMKRVLASMKAEIEREQRRRTNP